MRDLRKIDRRDIFRASLIGLSVRQQSFLPSANGDDPSCIERRRVEVSAAFFLSQEFQLSGLNNGTETRATVLRKVVDNPSFFQQEFNSAFVLMQYFGYLRRDPEKGGYEFWLSIMNRLNGDFKKADMVKAFIISAEYHDRFRHH